MQQALLKIIEGTNASVPPQGGEASSSGLYSIDLLISVSYAWAFEGLRKNQNRLDRKSIGFNAEIKDRNETEIGKLLNQFQP